MKRVVHHRMKTFGLGLPESLSGGYQFGTFVTAMAVISRSGLCFVRVGFV